MHLRTAALTACCIASVFVTAPAAGAPKATAAKPAASSRPRASSAPADSKPKTTKRRRSDAARSVPRLIGAPGPAAPKVGDAKTPRKNSQRVARVAKATGLQLRDLAWARLSPAKPWSKGRAWLELDTPLQVDPAWPVAVFGRICMEKEVGTMDVTFCEPRGAVEIVLETTVEERFAIACDVEGVPGDGNTWILAGKDGPVAIPSEQRHQELVFTVDATYPGRHVVALKGTHREWKLYGCVVYEV